MGSQLTLNPNPNVDTQRSMQRKRITGGQVYSFNCCQLYGTHLCLHICILVVTVTQIVRKCVFLDWFALGVCSSWCVLDWVVGEAKRRRRKKKKAWQSQAEAVTGCHDGKVMNALLSSVTAYINNNTQNTTLSTLWNNMHNKTLYHHKLSGFFLQGPSHSVCECVCGNQHTTLVTGQGL